MRYISRKQLVWTSTVLLIVTMVGISSAYMYGLGQNNNSNQKAKDEEVTAEKATVRESKKRLRAKDGFEFVQEGKNKVSVRRFSTGVKASGAISCFCEKDAGGSSGAFCDARVSPDGKTTTCAEYGCTGCGINLGK